MPSPAAAARAGYATMRPTPCFRLPMPLPPAAPQRPARSRFRLSRAGWIAIAAAALIGVLLSLLLLRDVRQDTDFYRADKPVTPGSTGGFEALPAPVGGEGSIPTGADGSGDGSLAPIAAPPTVVESPSIPTQPPPMAAPPLGTDPGRGPSAFTQPPRPIDQEQPAYPSDAYRNGDTGTVVLRITVGEDGHPYGIAIARSSRSRSLDRAAISAARRWRFEPAIRNGVPVSDTVEIPVVFTLDNQR